MPEPKLLAVHAYRFVKRGDRAVPGPEAEILISAAIRRIAEEPNGYHQVLLLGGRDDPAVAAPLCALMNEEFRLRGVAADFRMRPLLYSDYRLPCDTAEEAMVLKMHLKNHWEYDRFTLHAMFCSPWGPRVRNAYDALRIRCAEFIPVPCEVDRDMRNKLMFANLVSWVDPLGRTRFLGKPFRENRQSRMQPGDELKKPLIK